MDFISIISCLTILVCLFEFRPLLNIFAENNNFETYIVHVQSPFNHLQLASYTDHDQKAHLETWYHSFLPTSNSDGGNVGEGLESESRLLYSYQYVFNGFAARLSREEVKEMEKKKGFISAQPQEILSLQTTHSPYYLGLIQNSGLWKDSKYGKGVIIGVLDSGIIPNHPSFRGDGIPPPPAKWKGKCEFNGTTTSKTNVCNNKLIGIRYFGDEYGSGLDEDGHGSHTASTAAGNFVQGANVYGNANGTAMGVAPLAHLAIYKVCNKKHMGSCAEIDILAGIDTAIKDRVDIISISLGFKYSMPFHMDNIAIGSFRAMERGILVSTSAGNKGPSSYTLNGEAPWVLSVGASTTDRKIIAIVKLGNKMELEGESIYQPKDFPSTMLPLVYPESNNTNDKGKPYCLRDSLINIDIKGKIVVCMVGGGISSKDKGKQIKKFGGVGMILINNKVYDYVIIYRVYVLPTTHLNYANGILLKNYIKSSHSPTVAILFKGTSINPHQRSPVVAPFSSRGPSVNSPGILKPDILGPGVNILAAWPYSIEKIQNKRSTFNIISGTSMSCPHLSGVAALLKSVHPDWSPTAIMSSIITTADTTNHQNHHIDDQRYRRANIFAIGAGHVNPSKANNPGLVYNIHRIADYISYLCGLNYTNTQVSTIANRNVKCSDETSIAEAQLNYPSISVFLSSPTASVKVERTVTNVGDAVESYTIQVVEPYGVSVIVEPTTLSFVQIKQNLTYEVLFTRLETNASNFLAEGSLFWISAKHRVRSPIVTIFN